MLNHEDADLSNITDAAVEEDAVAAAWNLTALAAEAIRELATTTNRTPHQVLADIDARGFGGLVSTGKHAKKAWMSSEGTADE